MTTDKNSRHESTKECMAQGKLSYVPPVLQVYGAIRQLTNGTATVGNDGTNTRKNAQSDRATKENIVRVADHPLGFGLYLFEYKHEFREQWGQERQFGVMADEVETVMPDAVSVHSNGYKMVDYAALGIVRTFH